MEHNQANEYPVSTTFIYIKKSEKIKKITISSKYYIHIHKKTENIKKITTHYEYFTEERKRKEFV